MNKISIALALLLLLGCNKEKLFDGPDSYSDDFEGYASIDGLFDGGDSNWSYFQSTFEGNALALDSVVAHSGKYSLRASAEASTEAGGASKASVAKHKMAFWEGETVFLEAWYYLEGTAPAQWLFLMDVEEQAAIGAGPGIRVALVDDRLLIEHKYPKPNIPQPEGREVPFPRDRWVHIRLEVLLAQQERGAVRLWQDGDLLIEQSDWQTLPKDILYFQQGTKGMYSSVEFGITANSSDGPLTLYVDDVKVGILE